MDSSRVEGQQTVVRVMQRTGIRDMSLRVRFVRVARDCCIKFTCCQLHELRVG